MEGTKNIKLEREIFGESKEKMKSLQQEQELGEQRRLARNISKAVSVHSERVRATCPPGFKG